ncbi:MAG: hypothetical protein AABZ06_12005 [Bdellovibrionota bacterium]
MRSALKRINLEIVTYLSVATFILFTLINVSTALSSIADEKQSDCQILYTQCMNEVNQNGSARTQSECSNNNTACLTSHVPAAPAPAASSAGELKELADDAKHPEKYKNDEAVTSESGDCGTSEKINGKYTCKGTKAIVQGAQITNMVGQAAGSITTQVQGMNAQVNTIERGTQSAALEGAAGVQKNAGKMQVGLGAMNATLGVLQIMQMQKHNKQAQQIGTDTNPNNLTIDKFKNIGVDISNGISQDNSGYLHVKDNTKHAATQDIINEFNLQGEIKNKVTISSTTAATAATAANIRKLQIKNREDEISKKLETERRHLKQIGGNASSEQHKVAEEAKGGGIMSLVTGTQQVITGAFNIKAAEQMQKAADNMKNIEENATVFKEQPFDPNADQFEPRGSAVITGSGQNTASGQAASSDDSDSDGGDLGPPIGQLPPNDPTSLPPSPGPFNVGGDTGTGGGGGGNVSGGSTPPETASAEGEQAPRMAGGGSNERYEVGGGFRCGGGGGAGGGPDLSGLLAQFLPKKDDELPKNGILDYGRHPASEAPLSLLDRNANIFERIHEAYQEKHRRGSVGGK